MIPITKDRLAAVYDMLRAFPPFTRWKLPPAEMVRFHVSGVKERYAKWWIEGDTHHIEVSQANHTSLLPLVMTMAHELIHVYQRIKKTETRAEHNPEFKRLAKRICAVHGWDYISFMG